MSSDASAEDLFSSSVRKLAHRLLNAESDDRRITFEDLKIRAKDRKIVSFSPNPIQIMYLDQLCPDWRSGRYEVDGMRELILKARQFGFSTLILAIYFCQTMNEPNTQTVVVAHDAASTERLFRIVRRFYEHLPPHKKMRTRYANTREYLWPDIDSCFFVGTAGSRGFGRGGTINYVHGSEVAFWPEAEELVTGLMEAVPESGCVILESTANGFGNWYQVEFDRAGNGQSAYSPKFFPWFMHEEYRRPLEEPLQPAVDPEERERERILRELHGCDDAQINWRRQKQKALKGKFAQEYPSTPREAFLVSGAKYFDAGSLEAMEASVRSASIVPAPAGFALLGRHWERMEVFQPPRKGRRYVVSADTAEGLDDSGDPDYDSADVLDCESWEQVAHLHGRWDTHTFGMLLAELGRWYNTALLGIERNNHGHAVINAALHSAGYPEQRPGRWSGLYLHDDFDELKREANRKPGWPTTAKTKFFALDTLATSIETGDLKVRSAKSLGELRSFLKLPHGRAGAAPRTHDDQVMSLAIGAALLKMRPRRRQIMAGSAEPVNHTASDYEPLDVFGPIE